MGLSRCVLAIFLAAVAGPGAAPQELPGNVIPQQPAASGPPPLPAGPPPDLDLVFTSQVIGWIEPCG